MEKTKKAPKAHKFRPGTVALRNIKNLQKGDKLMLRRTPFERLVREKAAQINANVRFSEKSLIMIQAAIEEYVTRVCHFAYNIALAAKRQTLMEKDIKLAQSIISGCYV